MKNKHYKMIAIIIPVLMLLMAILPSCDSPKKKAIIILPGILASGLYDTSSGEPLWDPFTSNIEFSYYINHSGKLNISADDLQPFIEEAFPLIEDIILQTDESILKRVAVDEDGVPLTDIVAAANMTFDNPTRLRYGIFNCCTEMYNELNNRYGSKAEVVVFNYDWRLDNRDNADALETFINENGYEEITILAHSMGGDVASIYLAKSEENRKKVNCFTTYDTPYFGAVMALEVLENMEGMVDSVLETVAGIDIVSSYLDSLYPGCQPGFGMTQLRNVLMEDFIPLLNIPSLYQLLPSPELLSSGHFYNNWTWENYEQQTSFIKVNDSYISTKNELLDFYKSRDWAYKDDDTLKAVMSGLDDYWNSMYVEVDGKMVHSTSLVNTHYFVGINYSTSSSVNYTASTDSLGAPIMSTAVWNFTGESSTLGDGTVLAYSSIANNPLTASNVHIVENADHFDVAIPFEAMVADETYSFLDDIIFD
ncbi:MAG: hypothetical protein PHE93_05255 [Clostridia bacterium]|nr:hypothetical protein [Clostridia bacterium]